MTSSAVEGSCICSRAWHYAVLTLACFPALGTACIYSRAWHQLHLSRVWHRLHLFRCMAPVTFFPCLAPFVRFAACIYIFPRMAPITFFPRLARCISECSMFCHAWHHLYVLPLSRHRLHLVQRLAPCTACGSSCIFSRAWHQPKFFLV